MPRWVWFLFLLLCIPLARTTAANGIDFEVYWKAANFALNGRSVYSLAESGHMVFKYPPWFLAPFLPIGLLPLGIAKWFWALVQTASLGIVFHWTVRNSQSFVWPLVCLVAFWGIWAVHAFVGQITLPLLAAGLLLGSKTKDSDSSSRKQTFAISGLAFLFSAKVFTLFPLLGLPWKKHSMIQVFTVSALLAAAMSLPAVFTEGGPMSLAKNTVAAMTSGGADIGGQKLKTASRENQGFAAAVVRAASLDRDRSFAFVILSIGFAILFGFTWWKVSSNLSFPERWSGWLALTAVVQPLSWFHTFAFAFPLLALTLDKSFSQKRWGAFVLAMLSLLFVAVITKKTLGPFGESLEMLSIKSWGVLIACGILVYIQSKPRRI